jgi:aspartyl-tRNA(Asn)/glutamyl-tRNA(Gln) amidotransferase subunit B
MKFTKIFINNIKKQIPELPDEKYDYFVDKFGIRSDYAEMLISRKEMAIFAEKALEKGEIENIKAGDIANYLINQKVDPEKDSVKDILDQIKKKNKSYISDENKLDEWIEKAIKMNKKAVDDYKSGKLNALFAIVGAVMKMSHGKADPKLTKELLEKALK